MSRAVAPAGFVWALLALFNLSAVSGHKCQWRAEEGKLEGIDCDHTTSRSCHQYLGSGVILIPATAEWHYRTRGCHVCGKGSPANQYRWTSVLWVLRRGEPSLRLFIWCSLSCQWSRASKAEVEVKVPLPTYLGRYLVLAHAFPARRHLPCPKCSLRCRTLDSATGRWRSRRAELQCPSTPASTPLASHDELQDRRYLRISLVAPGSSFDSVHYPPRVSCRGFKFHTPFHHGTCMFSTQNHTVTGPHIHS